MERYKYSNVINLMKRDIREQCFTSVSSFVAKQHLHLSVLLQRLQQDVALLVEQEEEWQGDVICVAAISGHLKERSCVAAAALVIVWKECKSVKVPTLFFSSLLLMVFFLERHLF